MTPVRPKYLLKLGRTDTDSIVLQLDFIFESDDATVMMALASFCQTVGYKEEMKNAPKQTEQTKFETVYAELLDILGALRRERLQGPEQSDQPRPDPNSWGGPYRDPDDRTQLRRDPVEPD